MKKALLLSIITLTALYFGWKKISSPYGVQAVNYAPAAKECFKERGFSYCVYKAASGTNSNIAYHLHGRNQDENIWNDDTYYTAMVQRYWQERGIKPPTVVAVSFGPQWLLAPAGSAPKSGLLDMFLKTVIPAVEARTGTPKTRILFGESMGGLNSLVAGLNAAPAFDRVAALCPGVYATGPFAPWREIYAGLKRTGADPKIIFGLMKFSKRFISDEAEWNKISPLRLAEAAPAGKTKFYLSCGLYDRYGNYEGTERLALALKKKGFAVEWRPLYGGHCATDVGTLAEFLGR